LFKKLVYSGVPLATKNNRRRTLIVEPRFQFRYLVLPTLVTVTTGACLFALFYLQGEFLWAVEADEAARAEIRAVRLQAAIAAGAIILAHIALVVWLGLVASHRVAGPVYRFMKTMKAVSSVRPPLRVTLRERDQLKEMAHEFNAMMERLAVEGTPNDESQVANVRSENGTEKDEKPSGEAPA